MVCGGTCSGGKSCGVCLESSTWCQGLLVLVVVGSGSLLFPVRVGGMMVVPSGIGEPHGFQKCCGAHLFVHSCTSFSCFSSMLAYSSDISSSV